MYVTVVNAQQMSHANALKQKIQLQARALKTRKHEAHRVVSSLYYRPNTYKSAACPPLFHQFNISNMDISVILSQINHILSTRCNMFELFIDNPDQEDQINSFTNVCVLGKK